MNPSILAITVPTRSKLSPLNDIEKSGDSLRLSSIEEDEQDDSRDLTPTVVTSFNRTRETAQGNLGHKFGQP